MATTIDGLHLRMVMGADRWRPAQPFGPDGWRMEAMNMRSSVIATVSTLPDDPREFVHASIAHSSAMPTYGDLTLLHRAVFGERWAYQVFTPTRPHVNIHEYALHLWGLLSGEPLMPDFGSYFNSI